MRIRKRMLNHPAVFQLLNKIGVKRYFSQNQEDKIIAGYFGDFKGSLLSIGENDGVTYSNALHFILRGWSADLVEPSTKAFSKMKKLHRLNDKIMMHKIAIGEQNGIVDFYDSGELEGLGDTSLVSTIHVEGTKPWTNVSFKKTRTRVLDFRTFHAHVAMHTRYELVSIDAELSDLSILKQLDLTELGCKCLVIEHANDDDIKDQMIDHCSKHGLSLFHTTPENFIFAQGKAMSEMDPATNVQNWIRTSSSMYEQNEVTV